LAISDLFRGRALNAIDKKGRVSVPSDFRATIQTRHRRIISEDGFDPAEGDADTRHANAGKVVIVTRDRDRPCLSAFEGQYLREFGQRVAERHQDLRGVDREKAIKKDLMALGRADDLSWDVNGRIVLSPRFCEKIGVDPLAEDGKGNLVLFFAMGETFEIWNPQTFIAAMADEDPDSADDVREMLADRLK
jgi:MraZ protein